MRPTILYHKHPCIIPVSYTLLYHTHSCIILPLVSYILLYQHPSCIVHTPISSSLLYHTHSYIIIPPVSYTLLYHTHSCIIHTPISSSLLYHSISLPEASVPFPPLPAQVRQYVVFTISHGFLNACVYDTHIMCVLLSASTYAHYVCLLAGFLF